MSKEEFMSKLKEIVYSRWSLAIDEDYPDRIFPYEYAYEANELLEEWNSLVDSAKESNVTTDEIIEVYEISNLGRLGWVILNASAKLINTL